MVLYPDSIVSPFSLPTTCMYELSGISFFQVRRIFMRSFGNVFEKYVDDKSTPYLSDDNGHLETFKNYALPLN